MIVPQPTEAQEAANAAYVWRKHVQEEMLTALRDPRIKLETAEWWFERFVNAYRRERQAEAEAKSKGIIQAPPR